MNKSQLDALKPKDGTVAEIRAAIDRIEQARAHAQAAEASARERLAEQDVLTLTTERRRALVNEAEDHAFDVIQCDALAKQQAEPLRAAIAHENWNNAFKTAKELEERLSAHYGRWAAEMPGVAAVVSPLVIERQQIVRDANRHNAEGLHSVNIMGLEASLDDFRWVLGAPTPANHLLMIVEKARAARVAEILSQPSPTELPLVTVTGGNNAQDKMVTRPG